MDKISELTEELKGIKALVSDDQQKEVLKIQEDNTRLKKQINEMEKFLNDYGLKWIGGGS